MGLWCHVPRRAGRALSILAGVVVFAASVGASEPSVRASVLPPPPSVKPILPPSPYVSPQDAERLSALFEAITAKRYQSARSLLGVIDEPMAQSLGTWAYLRSTARDITAQEIGVFLDRHYGWPDERRIQSKAEDLLGDNPDADQILAFFRERDPMTGDGHYQLARAFFAKGNEEAAIAQLRLAWIDYDWSSREEQEILSRYGRYLTDRDHWAKADRQLFEIKASATTRLLRLLTPTRRAEASARIAFLRRDRNAVTLYAQLPSTSQQDSGVLHAATRYYRRTDQEDVAVTYAGLAPLDRDALRDADAWFYERKRLARWALKTGRFDDAYVLSAFSGLEEGADFAEAEFMAGWVALRFLDDPERAKAHFAFLTTGVTSPISLARGEYWLARAWAASGDQDAARQHFRVAAEYPYTFYGQLAVEELGGAAPPAVFPAEMPRNEEELGLFEARPLVHMMRILSVIGEQTHFDRFARALDDQIELPSEVVAYHDLVMHERKTYLAVRAGKVARNNGAEVPAVIYPTIFVPQRAKGFAEEALILGLSRQESEFNPRAYSRARARGLMQLLSSTAQITARKEGIPYSTPRLMSDPNYNLVIGAAHLSHLMDRFDGSYIMVLAAYNAGPHRVTQWIETYGDPRDPSVDPIDWIELIPFSETRNYVMRVMENTQVYRARTTGVPIGGQLLADLVRGGNTPDAIGVSPPTPRLIQVAAVDGGGPNLLNGLWGNDGPDPLAVDRMADQLVFPPLATETNVPAGGEISPEEAETISTAQ